MTRRDLYIVCTIGIVGILAAFWFLAFSPKRDQLGKAKQEVQSSQEDLNSARQEASAYAVAKVEFPRLYASIARMGKAVPADADVPSLLVQLNHAAALANVDFRTVELKSGTDSGGSSSSASTSSSSSSSGSTAGSSGATGSSPGGAPASGSTGPSGSSTASSSSSSQSSTSGSPAAAAPADATGASTLPLGATVGPAGFPVLQFQLKFQGSFFKLADFIHNVRRLVQSRNKQVRVSGRLVTIDGIALTVGDSGFPQVKATIAATTYLAPAGQGVFAGATSQGPSSATPASTPSPSGGSGPPAAVVSAP